MTNHEATSNDNVQIITIDDLFSSFNANGAWLNGNIKQFVEDEDAELVSSPPLWVLDHLDEYDDDLVIRGKMSGFHNRIKISFSGLGFRRGILLMDEMLPDFPEPGKNSSNWYVGFTVAGNGTPAYIFPVKNEISRHFASKILLRALL